MRIPYSGFTKDQNGRIIQAVTVSVFLAGTATPASIYAASTGGVAVNSVISDDNGQFTFYVETAGVFKIVASKAVSNVAAYAPSTIDNISISYPPLFWPIDPDPSGADMDVAAPAGVPDGTIVIICNIGSYALIFDPTGLNQAVGGGSKEYFMLTPSGWR